MLAQKIMQLLFPPKCVLCGKILDKHSLDFCRRCRSDSSQCLSNRGKYPFLDGWAAVWYYEGFPRRSILRYKFRGVRSYAGCYGRMLAMRIVQNFPQGFDALVWVPISAKRRRKRGFDQGELLAEAVGKELGLQPEKLLEKIRDNPPQSGIVGAAQRRANVLGVYRVTDGQAVKDKRILLLDDVITTGATAAEAAKMLLAAGAKQVYGGAVAVARRGENKSR